MGGTSSRTDAFYTFRPNTPNDSRPFKMLIKRLREAHIDLRPQPPSRPYHTPTLIFADCNQRSSMEELSRVSHSLRPNELMVVLTSEVNPRFSTNEAMVQLLCSSRGRAKRIEEMEEMRKTIHFIIDFIARGGRVGNSGSAAAGLTPSSTATHPIVHMAFGDKADQLLKNAVSFVETECQMRLKETSNVHTSTPLLVFCKNDTKLQEDIMRATETTRNGPDVMLLIVTDKEEIVLRDTEATEHFGAKALLLFDHQRLKYSFNGNRMTLQRIVKFLERHKVDISLRLNRADSLRRSFTKPRKIKGTGFYLVLGDLSEEQLKNIVLLFDDLNVILRETKDSKNDSPLVVFSASSEQTEERFNRFRQLHTDFRDVFLVIVHRNCEDVPIYTSLTDVGHFGKLAIADLSPKVLDCAQNVKLVEGVKKFLTKHTVPTQRRLNSQTDQMSPKDHNSLQVTERVQRSSFDGGRSEPVNTVDMVDDLDRIVIGSGALPLSGSGSGGAGLPQLDSDATGFSRFPSMTTESSELHGHYLSTVTETHKGWHGQRPHPTHEDASRPEQLQHTQSKDGHFPTLTSQLEKTMSLSSSGNLSHESRKRSSWARRRKHPRPAISQDSVFAPATDYAASLPRGSELGTLADQRYLPTGGMDNHRPAAADYTSTTSPVGPVVDMAFGDKADQLLKDAVNFVETECQMKIRETSNLHTSTPLLVFCKNDTKLQEDIRHATEKTRGGVDVMLIIVTGSTDLLLRDTKATEKFGAKGLLLFSHRRQKFCFSDNKMTLQWIKKFLEKHSIEVSLKLNRRESWRRSFTKLKNNTGIGFYLVLGDLSEEQLKNIVLFFDDLNVVLSETEPSENVSPLIVFCAVGQQPEQRFNKFKQFHKDFRDVFFVIVHRNGKDVPVYRSLTDVANFGKLAIADMSPKVLDSAQNKKLVEGVRKFLRKHTVPSQHRPVSRADDMLPKDHNTSQMTEDVQCFSGDGGISEPDTVDMVDDTERNVIYSGALPLSGSVFCDAGLPQTGLGATGMSRFPLTTTESPKLPADSLSVLKETRKGSHGQRSYLTHGHATLTEQAQDTQYRAYHFPTMTSQPAESVYFGTSESLSHESRKKTSWARRRKHPRPAIFQNSVPMPTADDTAFLSREGSRERRPKRRVRDRNEDGGAGVIRMFEDLTINVSKKKKTSP